MIVPPPRRHHVNPCCEACAGLVVSRGETLGLLDFRKDNLDPVPLPGGVVVKVAWCFPKIMSPDWS